MKRILLIPILAFLILGLGKTEAGAHHLPHSGKVCQMVQVKWDSGWSEPMTKEQARRRTDHDTNKQIRFTPLDSTSWYESWHTHKIIRCIAAQRFHVSAPFAIGVAECESSGFPKASNGFHKGVYQQSPTFWSSNADKTNIGKADKQPGGADVFNGFANIWTGLSVAQHTWSPWSCAA